MRSDATLPHGEFKWINDRDVVTEREQSCVTVRCRVQS
jgi:hypothetical protein